MNEGARILVVEDDRALSAMLGELLLDEGYRVTTAHDGQRALHLALTETFDAVVLDRGLPILEGLDVLARWRRSGVSTPVLVLSALGNPADRVEGLDRGAEDYLTKPFDIDELLARIRALLRRHESTAATLVLPGGAVFIPSRRQVELGTGESVTLSERESALLEVLARDRNQVFERATLLRAAFPVAEEPGVVDTYVHYLRRKLGRGVITTVRGIGYRLGTS
ncbi:response regulator transcription factor [Cnuibacter physcomitrellae]|uniref:response regulator transcription factor n=1 Tax=Cnuibacter physcomitrellae TaxID=1619308 RepID=UPI002175BEF1|nr:response regulator transcription factor [Cnuibacter physcomitrellae]MCS5497053.1 response regulator transcription factor [Cnuibacter physcomitrellae]